MDSVLPHPVGRRGIPLGRAPGRRPQQRPPRRLRAHLRGDAAGAVGGWWATGGVSLAYKARVVDTWGRIEGENDQRLNSDGVTISESASPCSVNLEGSIEQREIALVLGWPETVRLSIF